MSKSTQFLALTGEVSTLTPDVGGAVSSDSLGNINVLGGTDISTDGSTANTLKINYTGATGLTWSIITGASTIMSVNNGYVPNRAGQVDFTLPTVSSLGDRIIIAQNIGAVVDSDYWKIVQNAGQSIIVNDETSTAGVGGYVRAKDILNFLPRTTIELVCIEANLKWLCISLASGGIEII